MAAFDQAGASIAPFVVLLVSITSICPDLDGKQRLITPTHLRFPSNNFFCSDRFLWFLDFDFTDTIEWERLCFVLVTTVRQFSNDRKSV